MPAEHLPLERLVEAARKDPDMLAQLLGRYRPFLILQASRQLPAEAPDPAHIVDETLELARRSFGQFTGSTEPEISAWIRQIHDGNFQQYLAGLASQGEDLPADRPKVPAFRFEGLHEDEELHEEGSGLGVALKPLPKLQREAVRLRYLEGWPVERIAGQLGKSVPATAQIILRGLQALRSRVDLPLAPERASEQQHPSDVSATQAPQQQPGPAPTPPQADPDAEQRPPAAAETKPSRVAPLLRQIRDELGPTRQALAERLEHHLRAIGTVTPKTLQQGQRIAREVNHLLYELGLRFCLPGTNGAATLAFLNPGRTNPGVFVLSGKRAGRQTTNSIRFDFSKLRVRPAPPEPAKRKPKS